MSEKIAIITQDIINECINKKIQKLDELHNEIKNRFKTNNFDEHPSEYYIDMYRSKLHSINDLRWSFHCLSENIASDFELSKKD